MKNHRSHVGRTRLILILLCIVLAAAMLWCALSLVLKIGTYSSRTVGDDKPAEEVPVEPADLEPTVAENSYDPAGFYEEGGFKRYKSADTIASVGVDVSSHQQDIDWELVAANGVEFAMIRVGYRGYTEGEIQPDDYFTQNIEGALAAGLDVGVYFFSQALDEKEAIDEANFVLESIKDYPLSYPVIFDWEDIQADARTDGMDSVQLTKNALAFCSAIEKAGYRAGVYFNQRFGYEEFDLESLQDYVFWLAEYNETPSFSYHFQLWQYCNDGRVDGIQTDVDLNLAFLRAKHSGKPGDFCARRAPGQVFDWTRGPGTRGGSGRDLPAGLFSTPFFLAAQRRTASTVKKKLLFTLARKYTRVCGPLWNPMDSRHAVPDQ